MEENVPPPLSVPPPLANLQNREKPRSRSRAWLWVLVVLGVLLCLLIAAAAVVIPLFRGMHLGTRQARAWQPEHGLDEVVFENNHSKNKIAIIEVDGIITSQSWDRSGHNMVDLIQDQLSAAEEDDRVKAVILKVDSPGGEVLASDDIAKAIAAFQKNSEKPVVVSMAGLAASGGYYVSAPCRWIVANELTMTGSIGVIMHSINYRGLMDKVGVAPQVFKSGKFKDMLSGSKRLEEVDPKEREMIQDMIDETFAKFKSVIAEGRGEAAKLNSGGGRELSKNWSDYADGRVLTGKQAYELGFVDELGNFDTAVSRANDLAGIEDANLIRYQQRFDISHLLGMFGQSESRGVKVDLGFDMPKLQAGRLYFLAPSFIH